MGETTQLLELSKIKYLQTLEVNNFSDSDCLINIINL